jgi:hypothetical protein
MPLLVTYHLSRHGLTISYVLKILIAAIHRAAGPELVEACPVQRHGAGRFSYADELLKAFCAAFPSSSSSSSSMLTPAPLPTQPQPEQQKPVAVVV